MTDPTVVDIAQLRKGCAKCSLQQLCLPAGIGAGDLERLDQIVRRRRPLARHERLFRPGDTMTAVYVARSGAFKTVSLDEQGEQQILGFHLPGELIGLDALGTGAHRCEAVALSSADVCEVPFDQLAAVASQLPALQMQLMRVIGMSVDRDESHIKLLARRHANERIALFLHGMGERLQAIGHSRTRISLAMSREDIANFLGLALETVSRGFSRLQDDGVIQVSGREVVIVDLAELSRLAHGVDAADPQERRA